MLSIEEKYRLNTIRIVDYLASIGRYPVKETGTELVYFSPIRNEATPSFFVNPGKNVFHDFGGDRGDLIRLVGLVNGVGFLDACKILQLWQPCQAAPVSLPVLEPTLPAGIQLLQAIPLANSSLVRYAESRRIPFLLAAKYLKEVYYLNRGTKYYALGFGNDLGGFELRNRISGKDFKACISPKGITTINIPGSSAISIFEGAFDFLSALVYFGISKPRNSCLVLNSTSNLHQALPVIKQYSKIFTFLDNDDAGRRAVTRLKSFYGQVFDQCYRYPGAKDMNEFLCSNS